MKNVYLNSDNSVREILPDKATPIDEWYNKEFASHCVEAPDEVECHWVYDSETKTFYRPEEAPVKLTTTDRIKSILRDEI